MSSSQQLSSEDTRDISQQSFSSSVREELEARHDPFPPPELSNTRHKYCSLCQQEQPDRLVAHQIISDKEAGSQVYDSKALGLFVANGFDVASAQNGLLVCELCHRRLRQRTCLLTLPTALLQLLDDRASSLLELAEDPIRAQSPRNSRIAFSLFGELRNLAGSGDAHKYLLGHYQVLHHALECLRPPTIPVCLSESGLVNQCPSSASSEQPSAAETFELVQEPSDWKESETYGYGQPRACSETLWRLRGVSPAAIISELFASFRAGKLTPDVLCNVSQRHNAEAAISVMDKLDRLLDKARTTDKGPQPLKESLVNLVPEVHLDRLSLLKSPPLEAYEQSEESTVAPAITESSPDTDSHVRPPPTDESKFEHGGRDTTTEQNVQRYKSSRSRKPGGATGPLLSVPHGDPRDDESTKVSPDTEPTSQDV